MKKLLYLVATAMIVTLHSVFVFVFLSLLTTIPVSMLAQEQTQLKEVAYHPFIKEGKVWNCQTIKRQSEGGSVYALYRVTTNYSLCIDGDTVIGGQSYKGSWGRFSDHFFDKKELNDVAIFK